MQPLAYPLDPRFSRAASQPVGVDDGAAIGVLKMLAMAHDTRNALTAANETVESKLVANCPGPITIDIIGEYTDLLSQAGSAFLMESSWEDGAVRNSLSRRQAETFHPPSLLRIAEKVKKLPLSLASAARSFSNVSHVHSKLRTRLMQKRLHQALYVHYNSRCLDHLPVGLKWRQLDMTGPRDGGGLEGR